MDAGGGGAGRGEEGEERGAGYHLSYTQEETPEEP